MASPDVIGEPVQIGSDYNEAHCMRLVLAVYTAVMASSRSERGQVKITFLRYPFPPREPLVVYEGLKLLSIREIATTKAYTIGRRGSYKDYVDLYFVIAEHHITLPDIVRSGEAKFGADFNSRLLLEQLLYV